MQRKSIKAISPGRINLIGEHTDYNEGLVLPAAIDKNTRFEIIKNGSESSVNIEALNINEQHSFQLNEFSPVAYGWQNYVMGVVYEIQKLGQSEPSINVNNLKGFDATFEGDVPIGSGMSSSASLECSLAFALNEIFTLGMNKWQIIKACQMAEHNFVGIKCGIMDQFASIMGKKDQVMLLDCRTLEFQYFPLELEQYEILLLNTNVSHSLASSEYNTRRSECEEGVSIIQQINSNHSINSLRDISNDMLVQAKDSLSPTLFKRCKHVISENERVLLATKALSSKNFLKLGEFIYQSHYSLSDDYEVSCPELDFLVKQTEDKDYIPGSRMMGGGFGGCTINIIVSEKVEEFIETVSHSYQSRFLKDLTSYRVALDDGARIIN